MIEPSGIPQFVGNLDQLEKDVSALRSDAIGIRNGGKDVHSRFQALAGVYKAPEDTQLFDTTRPVMDKAEAFATKLETVADALDTFSIEARPLAKQLAQLKTDALAFVDSVAGDDNWTYDEDKINRQQKLIDGVSAAESAFRDAERRAASKISALVGGPRFVVDDGSHTVNDKSVMYGYDLEALKHAKELPWGTPESESHHAWEVGYWAKSYVWDGLIVDNIWGGIKGLGTLVGIGPEDTSDAWGHIWDMVGGIGQYTAKPYDWVMDHTIGPDEESADEVRQKHAAKDFGKGLVAWDMWGQNPARASATVTFNLLTLGAGPYGVQGRHLPRPALSRPHGRREGDLRSAQAVRGHGRDPQRLRHHGELAAPAQRHRTPRRLQSPHQGRQVHPRQRGRQGQHHRSSPGEGLRRADRPRRSTVPARACPGRRRRPGA
ncbi:hypothetical protein AB0D12_23100 [Streptomyces sp. NPDC048479]|uniref:hypothetical protein n=1 Tax=Streptomyces sp. NPDC048479 TaxID=3154725 RepID=UPI00342FA258